MSASAPAPSIDPIAKVNELRARIIAGGDVSSEEMKAILEELRRSRKTIHETTTATKAKAAKSKLPTDLNELFKL